MVNGNEQTLPTLGPIDQHHSHQRTLLKIQVALGIGEQRFTVVQVRYPDLPQQGGIRQRLMLGSPLPGHWREA
ncbi:hypothetical protein D3C85_843890 [compost metagenome]